MFELYFGSNSFFPWLDCSICPYYSCKQQEQLFANKRDKIKHRIIPILFENFLKFEPTKILALNLSTQFVYSIK